MKKLIDIINVIKVNKEEAPIREFSLETDLRNDLGFDSLDLAEFTVLVEDEFEVDIFESGLVSTIGEVVLKLPKP